jgi:hypothetical protein
MKRIMLCKIFFAAFYILPMMLPTNLFFLTASFFVVVLGKYIGSKTSGFDARSSRGLVLYLAALPSLTSVTNYSLA